MSERMNKDVYYMSLAILASVRSTCVRRKVGCVAVKDNHIVATGYNGTVSETTHCTNDTCYRMVNKIPSGEKLDLCRAVHAEQNVICQAAIHGTSIKDATIYITTSPCITCLKLLAQVGVRRIVILEPTYLSTDIATELCSELGIEYICNWTDGEISKFKAINSISHDIPIEVFPVNPYESFIKATDSTGNTYEQDKVDFAKALASFHVKASGVCYCNCKFTEDE